MNACRRAWLFWLTAVLFLPATLIRVAVAQAGSPRVIDVRIESRKVVAPKGAMAFSDLMLESLFAEVWTRDVLSMRDRRLILLGAIGALGEKDTFAIQCKAALKNEELTPEQLREVVVLHDWRGLKHREIAEVVEASHAAVRKRYSWVMAPFSISSVSRRS